MATYRVVLRVEVGKDDILRSRGSDTLKQMQESGEEYLLAHVENEMGWLADSFTRVETQSITRVSERKQMPRKTKSTQTTHVGHRKFVRKSIK